MYKSRIKKTAGSLTVAVDSQNGELLSLVDESSGDNLIKNSSYTLPNPFALTIGGITLTAPSNTDIKKTPALQPEVREGASSITVVYPMLTDGVRFFDITVTVEIRCLPSSRLEFSIGVQNGSASRIDECRFPCVNGVFHGESYEDDTLVYPFNAGLKIRNPVAYLEKTPKKIYWRWQQYRYCYLVDGICTGANASGLYELNNLYSGPLSMPWIDYYSDNCGLYFGMNKTNGICSLSVSTFGKKSPGMNFSFVKKVETDGDFSMDGITLALHGGSWYEGADIYRASRPPLDPPRSRGWFGESIAVCAHYDFKYQNGGVVHTFADIPLLADTASEQGGDHLLISGWHTDGFDNGFPDYRPDPDLGSPDDLCSALDQAHARGVFVSFYINTRLCNRKFAHLQTLRDEGSAIRADGKPYDELYGDDTLAFNTMCASSEVWQQHLLDAIRYLVELGADGVYLDQLAMAAPRVCHDRRHGHGLYDWTSGYRKLLQEAGKLQTKAGRPLNIMIEGCSDLYGNLVDGQLVSTFSYYFSGAYPELYRYANPEQTLVDMVYPRRNNVMRPEHIGKRSTEMINRTYINNCYFWVYDLEEDNSFFNDPAQWKYLKSVLLLAKKVRPALEGFVFRDTNGIVSCDDGLAARLYENGEECVLLYASESDELKYVTLGFEAQITRAETLDGGEQATSFTGNKKTFLTLPPSRLGAIWLHK